MTKIIEATKENVNRGTISLNFFPENFEGTLIYGYDVNRNTIHVYVKDGKFFYLSYPYSLDSNSISSFVSNESIPISSLIPSKRVYSDRSLTYLIELLNLLGVSVPLNTNETGTTLKMGTFAEGAKILEDFSENSD